MAPSTRNHRGQLLDAAQQLILSKGFPATRVDEICDAAKVTKGSFYHHFKSKDELASALIDHYFDTLTEGLCSGSWQDCDDPIERLQAFLDSVMAVVRGPLLRRGCLLGSFALDLSETHPDIRSEIEDRLQQLANVLEPLIRNAFRNRRIKGPPNAPALARQFVSVLQGAIVMSKAYNDHGKVAEGVRCYRAMLEAMLQLQ